MTKAIEAKLIESNGFSIADVFLTPEIESKTLTISGRSIANPISLQIDDVIAVIFDAYREAGE